jgi:7-cyano-7-deazaguanine synthase in queuosine biosynthesis
MVSEFDFYSNLHNSLLKDVNFDYKDESKIIIDLVTIMGAIYCKDVNTHKSNDKPRHIKLMIPVFNLQLWSENIQLIEELANWVSEDAFSITFKQTSHIPGDYVNNLLPANNNNVTLFSGGLDSFAGAYQNFKNNIQSDYVGFVNKDEEKTKQLDVAMFYKQVFNDSTEIILIEKPIPKKKTFIQSTRSLLYLALAIAKAYFNSSNNVYLYENGILSLNPEIKNRYTTKTTHPKTMFLYRSILEKVNIMIDINHPFLFKTKGQIINDMDENFKQTIKHTFTCGQGRSNPERAHTGQCGVCIPCLLRKISLAAYDNEKYDVDYEYQYAVKINEIKEDPYRKDYSSNLNYFQNYFESIKAGRIHLEIQIREKYYRGDSNFRISNQEMFKKFAYEYERYMEKYAPY